MNRRHNAKFWLLMTGLAVIGGASLVGFKYSSLNADKDHINKLKAETQSQSSVQQQLDKSQKDLDDAKASLTHLEQGVPSTAYVPTMLQQLQVTGQSCGIAVTGVRPSVKSPTQAAAPPADGSQTLTKPAYDSLDIEVKGRGDYGSALKFIKALETFPKIVGVRTIDIVPCSDPGEAKLGHVDLTVGLRAYLFHDTTASPQGATAADGSVSLGDPSQAGDATKADASKADAKKPAAPAAGAPAKPDSKAKTDSKGKGVPA